MLFKSPEIFHLLFTLPIIVILSILPIAKCVEYFIKKIKVSISKKSEKIIAEQQEDYEAYLFRMNDPDYYGD